MKTLICLISLALCLSATAAERIKVGIYELAPAKVHKNLSIFMIYQPRLKKTADMVPLAEAMSKKMLTVHETGTVSQLQVENTSDKTVFIQAGNIVKGGKQDRVLYWSKFAFSVLPLAGLLLLGLLAQGLNLPQLLWRLSIDSGFTRPGQGANAFWYTLGFLLPLLVYSLIFNCAILSQSAMGYSQLYDTDHTDNLQRRNYAFSNSDPFRRSGVPAAH